MLYKRHVDYLNEHGLLNAANIQFWLHVNQETAIKILQKIVDQHTNVYFIWHVLIVIEGREQPWMFKKLKRDLASTKRNKFKDVKKP
ncbi:hypothetical protein EHM76_04730 [bacterium]|nr:MAG: hypothetical protein EHM76_04730 [bacterium]